MVKKAGRREKNDWWQASVSDMLDSGHADAKRCSGPKDWIFTKVLLKKGGDAPDLKM
jgi:hypothetical protein